MRKESYYNWLISDFGVTRKTATDYASSAERIELQCKISNREFDLDVEYNKDRGRHILELLEYNDPNNIQPTKMSIKFKKGSNIHRVMGSLRTAVKTYMLFSAKVARN